MTYPCGIIKDLLPLYMDNVCNEESRQAVEEHLEECESCRNDYDIMKGSEDVGRRNLEHPEDLEMADRLKCVKRKLNKRITKMICCVIAAAMACIAGYHLLFNAAIKQLSPEDVSITANVYCVEELIENRDGQAVDADTVTISSDENDDSDLITISIPEIGGAGIAITVNTAEEYPFISVVTVQSDYFLRDIQKERKDGTIYITAIKTTLLNNKTAFQSNICGLEFGEINRIVFVDQDGAERVLWSR